MFGTAKLFDDGSVLSEKNNKNQLILSAVANEPVTNDD